MKLSFFFWFRGTDTSPLSHNRGDYDLRSGWKRREFRTIDFGSQGYWSKRPPRRSLKVVYESFHHKRKIPTSSLNIRRQYRSTPLQTKCITIIRRHKYEQGVKFVIPHICILRNSRKGGLIFFLFFHTTQKRLSFKINFSLHQRSSSNPVQNEDPK